MFGQVIVDQENSDYSSPDVPAYSPLKALSQNNDETMNKSSSDENTTDTLLMTKKRKLSKATWKRNVIKEKLNKGLSYTAISGHNVEAKEIKEPCSEKCFHKCIDKIPDENRRKIFDSFYQLGDKNKQWDFINRNVTSVDKLVTRTNSRRSCTKHYYLPVHRDPLLSPDRVRVCQKFFLNTLSINTSWIKTVDEKVCRTNAIISPDRRGSYIRVPSPNSVAQRKYTKAH
jgi:hypothetical protein